MIKKLRVGRLRVKDRCLFWMFFWLSFVMMLAFLLMKASCWVFGQDCKFLPNISLELLKDNKFSYTVAAVAVIYVMVLASFRRFPTIRNKTWVKLYLNSANEFLTEFVAVLTGIISGITFLFLIVFIAGLFIAAFSVPGLSKVFCAAAPAIILLVIFYFSLVIISTKIVNSEEY